MSLFAVIGLTYPVGESARLVVSRGGVSKLNEEERKSLKWRRVLPGGACDDLPKESVSEQIRIGRVERRDANDEVERIHSSRGLVVRKVMPGKTKKRTVKKSAKKK